MLSLLDLSDDWILTLACIFRLVQEVIAPFSGGSKLQKLKIYSLDTLRPPFVRAWANRPGTGESTRKAFILFLRFCRTSSCGC